MSQTLPQTDPVQDALDRMPMIFSHHSLDLVDGPNGEPTTMVELLALVRSSFPPGTEGSLMDALDWFDNHQAQG